VDLSFSVGNLFAGFVFGMIGWGAFRYGKNSGKTNPIFIGIALMAYPYFISNAVLMWLVGAGLTASLFVLKD